MSLPTDEISPASLVVEHTVSRGKGSAFKRWHADLTDSAKHHEGYIRTDLCSPVQGSQLKWYSLIHFDSPEHLHSWLKSEDREKLLESGQQFFRTYRFKSFSTGLEGWFSQKTGSEQLGLGSPAWKQNLAVILGLYPTVVIQTLLFTQFSIAQNWSLANSMLLSNFISSSTLTWVVMPLVSRLLSFWLQSKYEPIPKQTNALGIFLIACALTFMNSIFNHVQ
ncbi:MAG: hypothetical protein KME15_14385 [Drouetiella hepatica Uher 2000/2452]|jgi:hypothetical protein|uniref:Antibiotic biosynthesis monooxygenase n=1 Tax=Drouetiella hepatica Uher 2000/2452 TaxID=904376 RepID=A0A951QCD3_9CYAN|nr:hypothetical protein [Drouetiella hepatica Uher 2000/2452]